MSWAKKSHFKIKHLLVLLLILSFITGCGGTLKNSWTNFRAYYNTYYNAEENFRTGLKKVREQPRELDPQSPVRIHPAPVKAGYSDFEKAIEKGAQILRRFPESKWADNALLLIGKSYYYQQEFYSAVENFEELRNVTESTEMNERAIIWKGRSLLDLDQYSEGISFLETQIEEYSQNRSTENRAEIYTLLGQHHTMLENWEEAEKALYQAISDLDNQELLGRSFFLYGQVLERLERYGEAYYAYNQVRDYFAGFEYDYWADFKKAEVSRKEGNFEVAIAIYERLSRDDKNIDRLDRLRYEIARTLEMQGNAEEAENRYKDLLYNNRTTVSRSLQADIYFRLGEIYSESYNKFDIAGAYFDSSSTMKKRNQQETSETSAPEELAEAYGNYTRLEDTIERADSLLWLGSLSTEALDSVLADLRRQKRQELLAEQETESTERLMNTNLENDEKTQTKSSIYGFLNYRDNELVERAQAEFQLRWGSRPLVDNWRRIEAVRREVAGDSQEVAGKGEEMGSGDQEAIAIDLNVEEIPKTEGAKNKLQREKANAQYELGNLLFMDLNMPDSARNYFHRVVNNNQTNRELRGKAMYSLYELFKDENKPDSVHYWESRILEEYPESKYVRIINNEQDALTQAEEDSASASIRQQYQLIASSQQDNKPVQLRKLALDNRTDDLAPFIHYQAIEEYIRHAQRHRAESNSLVHDSSAVLRLSNSESMDGLVDPPKVQSGNFKSAWWDSVRIAVKEFDTTFVGAPQQKKIERMRSVLERVESESSELQTCEELGISLSIAPAMEQFLSTVTYPEELKNSTLSGKLVYSFIVNRNGEIQSYRLESNKTSLGVEEAFEKAIEENLRFEPLRDSNIPENIRCSVSFPL